MKTDDFEDLYPDFFEEPPDGEPTDEPPGNEPPVKPLKPPRKTLKAKKAERAAANLRYDIKKPPFLTRFWPATLPLVRHLVTLLRLIGWSSLDIVRNIISPNNRLYGIWCFVGLPGYGKTMSLCFYLDNMRRKYGDTIYIATNFYYKGQDFHLDSWEAILKDYDKTIIFGYDELQNEFFTRNYKKFPPELIHELTQNRKGRGKQIVYTTQEYANVDKVFRDLTEIVVDCRTYFRKRFTVCHYYKRVMYECRNSSKSIEKKIKMRPFKTIRYVQTDYMRSRYNSFQRLDYLKSRDYVGIGERN